MRIQKQIGLGSLGVVAVSGLATMIAFTGQAFTRRACEAVSAESNLQATAALLERAVAKLMDGASIVARAEDPVGRQVVAEGRAELEASLASLERMKLDSSMAAEFDELKALAGSAAAANAGVLTIAGAADGDGRATHATERLSRTLDALDARKRALVLKVELFTDHARSRAQAAQVAAQRRWQRATVGIVALLAAALALAIALSMVLAQRIAKPIELLAAVARRVGAGDLSARASARREHEVGYLAAVFDQMLDDLQAAQARLVRSERLAAIGEITVTMQHELNNPLAGVSGAVNVLLDSGHGMSASVREALMMIRDAVTRMTELMAKLDRISEPVSKTYVGNVRMLDVDHSTR
jgi:signal transduction histidine kinase